MFDWHQSVEVLTETNNRALCMLFKQQCCGIHGYFIADLQESEEFLPDAKMLYHVVIVEIVKANLGQARA